MCKIISCTPGKTDDKDHFFLDYETASTLLTGALVLFKYNLFSELVYSQIGLGTF